MDNQELILQVLNRIEVKVDGFGDRVAKLEGYISKNGFVRQVTCHALHQSTKEDLAEFKREVKEELRESRADRKKMWIKIAGLTAAVAAFGKYVLPLIGA